MCHRLQCEVQQLYKYYVTTVTLARINKLGFPNAEAYWRL